MRRGTPTTRNVAAAALAAAVATGYLLTSGALDPVLSSAVTLATGAGGRAGADADELNTGRVADWMYTDDRPQWSTLRQVPASPAGPELPAEPARPAVAPPENPHRWSFDGPAPMPHYTLAPPPSCPLPHGPTHDVTRLTAKPGPGSAVVSWYDLGDPDSTSYSVAVVPVGFLRRPQRFGDSTSASEAIRYVDVAAPKTCQEMNVPISGLVSGDTYQFWLVGNNVSKTQTNMTYRPTRGQTEDVTIL